MRIKSSMKVDSCTFGCCCGMNEWPYKRVVHLITGGGRPIKVIVFLLPIFRGLLSVLILKIKKGRWGMFYASWIGVLGGRKDMIARKITAHKIKINFFKDGFFLIYALLVSKLKRCNKLFT